LLLAGVPVSVFVMLALARRILGRLKDQVEKEKDTEISS
jgi:hypothetical protein